jgi:hypothetical protein
LFFDDWKQSTSGGGEKMKKKILGVFGCLFFVVMMTFPVMATPATKIEGVTLSIVRTTTNDWRIVDHDIWQLFDGEGTGTVSLSILGNGDLPGTYEAVWHGKIKSGPMLGVMQWPEAECLYNRRMTISFTGEGTTGTFEGTGHTKAIGFPPTVCSYMQVNMVFHGTDDFQGQTLKLCYQGAVTPGIVELEGSLLMP